ncbi:MAG: hypothetical protein R2838_21985 [Caldilineaceae bacterium]
MRRNTTERFWPGASRRRNRSLSWPSSRASKPPAATSRASRAALPKHGLLARDKQPEDADRLEMLQGLLDEVGRDAKT